MDTLAAMRTFTRVAELRSFSRAADELGLSRAKVSTQVAALEKHYKARLLNRTTRQVALTNEGQRFLDRCQRVLDELREAEDDLSHARERPRGMLRVDVLGPFGRHLLIPALAGFLERYPELQLDLRISDRVADLVMDQVDVAVRGGTVTDTRLVAQRVATSHWITCAAPSYLNRHGWPRSVDDLAAHRLIGFWPAGTAAPRPWLFAEGRRQRSVSAGFRATSDNPEAVQLAAVHGAGIVQTTDLLAASALEQRELVVLLPGSSVRGPPVSVVYAPASHRLAKVRVFTQFTLELMSRWQRRVAAVTGMLDPA